MTDPEPTQMQRQQQVLTKMAADAAADVEACQQALTESEKRYDAAKAFHAATKAAVKAWENAVAVQNYGSAREGMAW